MIGLMVGERGQIPKCESFSHKAYKDALNRTLQTLRT